MNNKFTDVRNVSDYEVLDTNNKWQDVTKVLQTVEFDEYIVNTETKSIVCADTHVFIDNHNNKIYAKDCIPDKTFLSTADGIEKVTSVIPTNKKQQMYDLQLNIEPNIRKIADRVYNLEFDDTQDAHTYLTNGIKSHNTNIGKSLYLTHLASDYLKCGYNVLYVSAEMGARELYKRIDANVLNLQMDDLAKELPKTTYMDKVKHFAKRHKDSMGKLWIKEYPTGEANKLHIKSYLKDLKLKKQFTPDIVILDYLNIFSSCRLNKTSAENSYGYIKSITEEFRALAIEENCAVVTATQTNRCFSLDTKVETKSGEKIELRDINVGDEIKNNQGFVTVEKKYPTTHQQVYRITTKSGKSVICSEKHIFPTKEHPEGVSLETGLKLGDNFII